ncbi:unnamed protein product [Adineta steineri]|uniref:Uncharacterized protein n=1 Tax=Adineta steineri TaxID=433720 RepID=A0A815MCK7_9BILA|nr:unnamed protein product [Adineta steineri]CAF1422349.1 unnamed protein product [Adineta steineri]
MQTITPIDVHVDNDWRNDCISGSYIKKSTTTANRGGRQAPRMRTCVISKVKPNKTKSSNISQEITQSKQNLAIHSRSPSPPTREPWVPPPGRTTKAQKYTWQNSKARFGINSDLVHDDVHDDDDSLNTDRIRQNLSNEDVELLKERVRKRYNYEPIDQLRSDLNSSLYDLEQSQQTRLSRSSPPTRLNYRSASAGEPRTYSSIPKVSFENDSIIERRRARSVTPVRGPLNLNPERERLLVSLSQSEADVAQITKQLSSVKDTLTKLKVDNHPVSFEVEQLYQQRNELLHLIEQFENSNRKLKEFLRHQYHLEAEDGVLNNKTDTLSLRVHELENENREIRRLLLDRENDNVALQTELERVRTHAIGYDTMKNSLEHNRAHLQRELYAREGEINRLQCILRTMERDLSRAVRRTSSFSTSIYSSLPSLVAKTKGITIDKLQTQLFERDREIIELEKKLYTNKNEQIVDANSEIIRLRTKLEHAEHLVSEYKEQLHNHTLKTSINNSKTHLSEIELDKLRIRLQKRIEELEPLPELLRQAEMKNQDLQTRLHEQEKRFTEQAAFLTEFNSKTSIQNHILDRLKDNHYPFDDDHSTFQPKNDTLQRQLTALEDDNATLLRNLNVKEEALRNTQARLNAKTHELTSLSKQIDIAQTDLKTREDTYTSKERSLQQRINDLEQQISKLRLDCTQLKRDKDDAERRYTSQLGELRDKLEQSNNNNRSIQSYVSSLKTTYATVFNDTVPSSTFTLTSPFSRYTSTPSVFP